MITEQAVKIRNHESNDKGFNLNNERYDITIFTEMIKKFCKKYLLMKLIFNLPINLEQNKLEKERTMGGILTILKEIMIGRFYRNRNDELNMCKSTYLKLKNNRILAVVVRYMSVCSQDANKNTFLFQKSLKWI